MNQQPWPSWWAHPSSWSVGGQTGVQPIPSFMPPSPTGPGGTPPVNQTPSGGMGPMGQPGQPPPQQGSGAAQSGAGSPKDPMSYNGMDLTARYTPGNVIRIKNGHFYRVLGAADKVKKGKRVDLVRGRDGKLYRMYHLTEKEARTINNGGGPLVPKEQAPAQQGPPTTASGLPQGYLPDPNNPPGWRPSGMWWGMDWWNQPSMYHRMF